MGASTGKLPPDPSLSLLRIQADGLPPHSLLVHQPARSGHPGLAAFAKRWDLTRRQTEVLQQLLEGKANKVIGDVLGIQESTVELHVTSIFRKVGVEKRSELIAAYWSSGA